MLSSFTGATIVPVFCFRTVTSAHARAFISIAAIDRMGFGGAEVAEALNLTPSAVSKLMFRTRNDSALKKDVETVLNDL